MSKSHKSGLNAEAEVLKRIACPNCGKSLRLLPKNNPLFDVQCSTCFFRAQVKSGNNKKPQQEVFGATWDIMDKVLKAGYSIPPLITVNKWFEDDTQRTEIRFYPFIQRRNLKPYTIGKGAQSEGSRRFNYIGLRELPHFVLFRG